VVSLFRRVFSLFENLPEEGGKRNTVPKQEELVLKSVKSMLDIICLHLSDQLFDLVLKIVFDYAVTNARSNSVRVGCLALPCSLGVNDAFRLSDSSFRASLGQNQGKRLTNSCHIVSRRFRKSSNMELQA